MINILSLIAQIFKPAADLIDDLHTSVEEKAKIELAFQQAQLNAALQLMDYEKELLESKTAIITAEAKGESVLQRSWRPITMLVFLFLVVADSFGYLAFRLSSEAWGLLQLGIGGYVVGRSVEKVAPKLKELFKK